MTIVSPKIATINTLFVLGGQVVIVDEPAELVTILGSCVSVCLWDRKTLKGGMNHYLIPETVNDSKSLNGGIAATRKLIIAMRTNLPDTRQLVAQVFGGANRFFTQESFLNVGRQNVQAARIVLEEANIPVISEDVGGEAGRRISFNTLTGRVQIKSISYTVPEMRLD